MSTCITTQMWKETITNEKKRLKKLESEGFDISDSWSDLLAMDKAWEDKNSESMADAVTNQLSRGKKVSSESISELNANNPKKGKAKVVVKSGHVDENGKVMYDITFPNSEKVYTINAVSLTADQVSPKEIALNATQDDSIDSDVELAQVDKALTDVEEAYRLLDDLAEADARKDSDEHKQYLKDFVRMFVGKGFTEGISNAVSFEGKRTAGRFTFDPTEETGKVEVTASSKPQVAGNEMSAANKWVHEVGHAVTEFALRRKDPETRATMRRLRQLREAARKVITVDMLLPEVSIDPVEEKKIAEELLEYMFSNEVSGESEFLVHAVTNEKVIEALKDLKVYPKRDRDYANIFENIAGKLSQLLGFVVRSFRKETREYKGDRLALKLMKELARANNKTAHVKRSTGIISGVYENVVEKEDKLREFIEKYRGKLRADGIEVVPASSGKYQMAKWFVKNAPKFMTDDRYRVGYEVFLTAWGAKPEGLLQSWIRRMSETDTLAGTIDQLDALSQQIDARRTTTESIVINGILEGFSKKLDDDSMNVMTLVGLNTDLEVIYDKYGKDKVASILTNKSKLEAEINRVKKDIDSKVTKDKDGNWIKAQAKGLGFYMVTGKGSEVQNLNAENIVKGFGRNGVKLKADPEVVKLVDELATLESLKYTDVDTKAKFSELASNETKGVDSFINMHRAFKKDSDSKLFHGDSHRKVKGYIKDIYNGDISIEIAPMTEARKMKNMGYELQGTMNTTEKGDVGIFVNKDQINPRYTKQALKLTDGGRMGTTLTDLNRMFGDTGLVGKKDLVKAQLASKLLMKEFENGTYDPAAKAQEEKFNPMFNAKGDTVNFRYMMGKARKRSLLEQDIRGPVVLGRMISGMQDKVETKTHNKQVFEAVSADYEDNMRGRIGRFGRNGKEYIKISNASNNKEVQDIWSIMPDDFKRDLKREYPNGIFVRRDMMHMYFGNRDMTLMNAAGIKHLNPRVRHMIRQAELMWQELMKLIKVEIIIKTPAVIIGNVVSNFLYGVATGNNPIEVAKLQLDAIADMREFMNLNRELIDLEFAKKSGNLLDKDLGKIPLLKESINKHPMKEFASEGLFQAIVEDIGVNDLKVSNKITKKLNEKYLDRLPESARTGLNWLYLSERTSYFKLLTAATQLSDAAARKAKMDLDKKRYDRLIVKGTPHREALKKVFLTPDNVINELRKKGMKWNDIFTRIQVQEAREAFVNYSGEDRVTKYANDMGLVMFTKYLQRIQKVIKKGAISHPLNFMLALLGQSYVTGELDTIDDKWYDMPYSPDYLDRTLDLVVPAGFDLLGDAYKVAT